MLIALLLTLRDGTVIEYHRVSFFQAHQHEFIITDNGIDSKFKMNEIMAINFIR
jgi:hypothetical protein